jgi:hypothetical protein
MGEVLIPALALVNGATIARTEVDEVTYWHVELESHDVLIANGLPAESYLEMGNRNFFAEECVVDLNALPDSIIRTHVDFCRPFFADGPIVEAVRARLATQAELLGWQKTHEMGMHLLVDGRRVDPDAVGGLARFLVPSTAKDVTLVSETFVPSHWGTPDSRSLGVSISHIHVSDGLTCNREIAADHDALIGGFHAEEGHSGVSWRWTKGSLPIPSSFWADCRTHVFLKVAFDPTAGTRWIAPEKAVLAETLVWPLARQAEAA